MTTEPPHLTAVAAELLSGSTANRIRTILGERWVHYPRADHVLQILSRLLDHPRTTRMPSIAIYGDSGMGKTMIMEKFRREHPPLFDGEAGVERTRVLALQMAGKPGERRLHSQILTALGAPQNPRAGVIDPRLLDTVVSPFDRFLHQSYPGFQRPGTLLLPISIRIPVLAGVAQVARRPDHWAECLIGAVAETSRPGLAACFRELKAA